MMFFSTSRPNPTSTTGRCACWRSRDRSAIRLFPTCPPWPRPASPASRWTNGSACSPRRHPPAVVAKLNAEFVQALEAMRCRTCCGRRAPYHSRQARGPGGNDRARRRAARPGRAESGRSRNSARSPRPPARSPSSMDERRRGAVLLAIGDDRLQLPSAWRAGARIALAHARPVAVGLRQNVLARHRPAAAVVGSRRSSKRNCATSISAAASSSIVDTAVEAMPPAGVLSVRHRRRAAATPAISVDHAHVHAIGRCSAMS